MHQCLIGLFVLYMDGCPAYMVLLRPVLMLSFFRKLILDRCVTDLILIQTEPDKIYDKTAYVSLRYRKRCRQ